MKAATNLLAGLALVILTSFCAVRAADSKPSLTSAQTKFLASYESIRAALAADDLRDAKAAAAALKSSEAGTLLAKADSLNIARMAFKRLSTEAESIARGHLGYYVVHCPMVDSDWIQRTKVVSNPYLGREMAACGHVIDP